jgi:RNA polymerase sigma-70 factor (ECF subfamily)
MDSDEARFEQSVCACLQRGARHEAATRFLERHGDAIFAFLADRLRDRREAEEVFGQFAEDFWRGLAGFEGRASMRSWAFTLARNAASRHRRGPHRRAAHNLPLPEDSQLADLVAASWRSNTPPYRQTIIKDQLRAPRRKLSEEDQTS